MRDGRIPKLQKNFEAMQQKEVEKQRRREGWLEEQARLERAKKPLKIKPNFRDVAVQQREGKAVK